MKKRAHAYLEQNQYQATSPPPNFQRPTPAPAPFYLQGTEIPGQGPLPPGPQHQQPQQPQQQQQQQHQQQQHQQFPPRTDQPPRIGAAGKQPTTLQTTSPPPQSYTAYNPPTAQSGPRPQSTYGNPQELATSNFDSPVVAPNAAAAGAPHADPYSASVYSQDEYAPDLGPSAPPAGPVAHQQPQYTAYTPRPAQQHQDSVSSYDGPPAPTGSAPPVPQDAYAVTPPPPLQPSGPAYDSRQTLPSQHAAAPVPQPSQPQYKAYVPPGGAPAAGPHEPSAPQDFYRQSAY